MGASMDYAEGGEYRLLSTRIILYVKSAPSAESNGSPAVNAWHHLKNLDDFNLARRHNHTGWKTTSISNSRSRMADNGDPWTFWLAEHGPALVLLARQWVDSRADAEDVV